MADSQSTVRATRILAFAKGRWRILALSLLSVIALAIAILRIAGDDQSYENSDLIAVLNVAFITFISFVVCILIAKSFLLDGSFHLVCIGCGWLVYGIALLVSPLFLPQSVDGALKVHNVAALVAGACQLASAVAIGLQSASGHRSAPSGRPHILLASYGAAITLIAAISIAAVGGIGPLFFDPAVGFTVLRQSVLGLAVALFAAAALIYVAVYALRSDFAYWYALSLTAEALGLTAVLIQPSVGSAIGWLGRGAQQVGGIYLLVAVAIALREARVRKVSVPEMVPALFHNPIARYQMVFDAAFTAIVSTDHRGLVQLWNAAAERVFGYSADQAVGAPLGLLVVPPGRNDFVSAELKALRSRELESVVGEPRVVEAMRKDGQVFPATFSFSARKVESGWLTSVMIHDITVEKKAEDTARRQTAILQGINRILGQALASATLEDLGRTCLAVATEVTESKIGFIGEVNAEGQLDDIAISDPVWEACRIERQVGPGRRPPSGFTIHGIYGRVILDGKGFYANAPALHPDAVGLPDGHPPLSAFLGVPLARTGRIIGMIAVANRDGGYRDDDLAALQALAPSIVQALDRKRAEEALRESEERQRLVLTNSPDIVFAQDRELRYTMIVNPAFPWREADVLGKTDFDLLPAADAHTLAALKRSVMETGRGEKQYLLLSPGGIERWYEAAYEPLRDDNGQVVGVGGYARDVTDRKRAEAEREVLLQAEHQSRKAAEEAVHARDEFLSVAAHELKTPITSLRGYAQTLLRQHEQGREVAPERLSRAIQVIDQQSGKMAKLVSQLLDLSRLQGGQLILEPKRTDLVRLVQDVVSAAQLNETRHALLVHAPSPVEAFVDPLRIEQVITSLVDNAIRYSPSPGPVEIEVAARDGNIEIAVRDHGIGIPPEHRAHVFDRFYRAHEGASVAGLGLGLYISKEIVTLHGGRISVECPAGGGSRFTLSLPIGL